MAAQQPVAITNVTVISMADTVAAPARTVIIQDGRIAQVGSAGAIRVPAGARVVDGTGKFLIPGLFEMHAHTSKTRASALGLYVVHGVTTIRDQGSEHAEVLRWRRRDPDRRARWSAHADRGPVPGVPAEHRAHAPRPAGVAGRAIRARPDPHRVSGGRPPRHRLARGRWSSTTSRSAPCRTARPISPWSRPRTLMASGLVGHVVSGVTREFLESGAGRHGPRRSRPPSTRMSARAAGSIFWRELAARDVGVVPTLVVAIESVFQPPGVFPGARG